MQGCETLGRSPHLDRTGTLTRTEHRVRHKGDLGGHRKQRHRLNRHAGNLGELVGGGFLVDHGVGHEQRVLGQHDRIHGGHA